MNYAEFLIGKRHTAIGQRKQKQQYLHAYGRNWRIPSVTPLLALSDAGTGHHQEAQRDEDR